MNPRKDFTLKDARGPEQAARYSENELKEINTLRSKMNLPLISQEKQRNCLYCGKPFMSQNDRRVCRYCRRELNTYVGGFIQGTYNAGDNDVR